MKLTVRRNASKADFTTGRLFIDGVFQCFTLEDERRAKKVMHETCIPAGTYPVELRLFGGHHERYKVKFPDVHKGMLWVKNVPGFTDILIHIGNHDDHTSGCLLVGTKVDEEKGFLYQSTVAYLAMYEKVLKAFERGEKVTIEYV